MPQLLPAVTTSSARAVALSEAFHFDVATLASDVAGGRYFCFEHQGGCDTLQLLRRVDCVFSKGLSHGKRCAFPHDFYMVLTWPVQRHINASISCILQIVQCVIRAALEGLRLWTACCNVRFFFCCDAFKKSIWHLCWQKFRIILSLQSFSSWEYNKSVLL